MIDEETVERRMFPLRGVRVACEEDEFRDFQMDLRDAWIEENSRTPDIIAFYLRRFLDRVPDPGAGFRLGSDRAGFQRGGRLPDARLLEECQYTKAYWEIHRLGKAGEYTDQEISRLFELLLDGYNELLNMFLQWPTRPA